MALILNIETASPVCSVSLSREGKPLSFRESSADKSHATRLTIYILELLEENRCTAANLDAISLSMGPGSYTGLRIGASVAKGLAYGSGVPLIGIPTLLALANGFLMKYPETTRTPGASKPALLCPMLDARRMEVYAAVYDANLVEVGPVAAVILEPRSFEALLDDRPVCFFGTGSHKAAEIIKHPRALFFPGLELSATFQSEPAETACLQQQFLDTAYFEPHYLKEFIAGIPKKKVIG